MSNLFLNIIPFSHPSESITFSFSKEKQRGWYAFRADKLPVIANEQFDKKTSENEKYLYTDFNATETGLKITVPMAKHLGFAKRYYTFLIDRYFRQRADAVTPNFIKDNEIWFRADESNPKYTLYKKIAVKVDFEHYSGQPQLTISYEGTTKVAKKSVEAFIEEDINSDLLKKVIYNKQIIRYNRRPEAANYTLDTIYPIINRSLGIYLGIPNEADFSIKKYKTHYDENIAFFNEHINTDDFKRIIPHKGKWLSVEKPLQTTQESNLMVYGFLPDGTRHKGHTPKDDIKKGPYKLVDNDNSRFIFIVHEKDVFKDEKKITAASTLYDYIKGKQGFFSINKQLKLPITFDKERNIIYTDNNNPLPDILKQLADMQFPPDKKYLALYISPISKDEEDDELNAVYYKIKEALLKKRISSQVVDRKTIFSNGFKFSIQNIGIAAIAKLGHIPWVLDRPVDEELIVGIGAFKPKRFETRYLGSAFCFSNNGVFKGFDCFPENDLFALAGSIREAVERFQRENKDAKRVVIHYFKKVNEKEVNTIQKELYDKLDKKIPIVFLTINKTESKETIVFDENYESKMPLSGTYVPAGYNTYLLCNNTRYSDAPIGKLDGHPLPVKVKIHSTDNEILQDSDELKVLIEQVYQFSRMYWKSVKQQNLPVTIKYPEMIARMIPYFENKNIPEFGKNNLWFL